MTFFLSREGRSLKKYLKKILITVISFRRLPKKNICEDSNDKNHKYTQVISVSYTHLDVYKRQAIMCTHLESLAAILGPAQVLKRTRTYDLKTAKLGFP